MKLNNIMKPNKTTKQSTMLLNNKIQPNESKRKVTKQNMA